MKKRFKENYLEKIPSKTPSIAWGCDQNNLVTLEVENKGVFNKIAQLLLKKPKITFIHLEEFGSFIWQLIDGETDIAALGEKVKEHFGDRAEPLYPRLIQYFESLKNCKFITLK